MGTRILSAVVAVIAACSSCATFRPTLDSLPRAVAYAQDAQLVLDGVAAFEAVYFATHDNPALKEKVDKGIADARVALDVAIRLCTAADQLSSSQVAEAFSSFRLAFAEVLGVVYPTGAKPATTGGKFGVVPGGYAIPTPLVLAK